MNSIVLLVLFCTVSAAVADECLTPDKTIGTCISLKHCPQLLSMAKSQPITNTSMLYLRRSKCPGFVGAIPKVCCPPPPPSPTTSNTPSTKRQQIATTSQPQRIGLQAHIIDDHPNLNLINTRHCGNFESSAIVGGRTADLYEFPWLALLEYTEGSNKVLLAPWCYSCTGTLINKRYVLTAAHCIKPTLTTVRLGEYDTSKDPDCEEVFGGKLCAPSTQNVSVGQTFVHPGYLGSPLANDIGLIRLATPADLESDTVKPVCLPVGEAEQDRNLLGTPMIVSGWGITCNDWSKLSAECGGTLITPYYVLTAAHCINSDLKQVTLGEHNQLTDPDCVSTVDGFDCADEVQHLEVAKTIKHPKYNRANIVNDIALIRLKTPATINEYVRTICLPVKPIDESVLFNMNLTVAGWGVTEQNTSSDVLMKVNVPAMSRVDCYNAYSSKGANISLSDNQLCAGGDGKSDSCNGDSGGPLKGFPIGSSKYTQYGIVSFGTKRCATRGVPAVYTAVYKYISWILCTINP